MDSLNHQETWNIIHRIIAIEGKKLEQDIKKRARYIKYTTIINLEEQRMRNVFNFIDNSIPEDYDKSVTNIKFIKMISSKFLTYIKLKIGYQEFKDGLIKLLNVDYETAIKSLILHDEIHSEDNEWSDDRLYPENLKYKKKVDNDKYIFVTPDTEGAVKCYACVCGWCKAWGLTKICIYTSRYYTSGHFILGVVCMTNLELYAQLEKDADIKDILLKMVEDLKEKHKDLNKKKCKGCDKRNVIRNREKGLLIGNYCKECIKTHRICKDCKEVFKFRENYEKKCDKCYFISKGKCIPIKVEYKFNN